MKVRLKNIQHLKRKKEKPLKPRQPPHQKSGILSFLIPN